MDKIEKLIEKLGMIKDGKILSELNQLGVSVSFLPEGIRWKKREG